MEETMAKITLTEASRLLLGIINSVEAGVTTPADAVKELSELKKQTKQTGLNFKAEFTQEDFENIRQTELSKSDNAFYDASYEPSEEPSY
jgi:hypothetical protein